MPPTTVLVTGVSGYVAQFVLRELLASTNELTLVGTSHTLPEIAADDERFQHATFHQLDVTDKDSVKKCFTVHPPDVIVHCAAKSSPGACEKQPDMARAVNSPELILDVLDELGLSRCNIVYLSTDQVYQGTNPPYSESDETIPLNTYAKMKLEFEHVLAKRWAKRSIVLRCSNIYGPLPCYFALKGTKFLQWLDGMIRKPQSTELFEDEFRSFVSVEYVARACAHFVNRIVAQQQQSSPADNGETTKQPKLELDVYNCGGPQGMNRVDVARTLVSVFAIPDTFIDPESGASKPKLIPVPRAAVNLGYDSGLNITMDSSKLSALIGPDSSMEDTLRGNPTSFTNAVCE